MECPNCKLENPPSALRCDCGHAFSQLPGETRRCPFCAETIHAAANKCRYCGESLVRNPRAFRAKMVGIGIVVVIPVGWVIYAFQNPLGVRSPFAVTRAKHEARVAPAVVTMVDYLRIRKGMSYKQVRTIIGTEGTETSRSELAGYTTVMYSWKNGNGSNMNAMFQNDALVTKAQFGLQ